MEAQTSASPTPQDKEQPQNQTQTASVDSLLNTNTNQSQSNNISLTNSTTKSINLDEYITKTHHTELLTKRETQLTTLAKSNAKLQEINDKLNDEKTVLQNELSNYVEKCNLYKVENSRLTEKANQAEEYQKVIADKEESVRGLLAEGEKLSKQQMSQQQANKKLRVRIKEFEAENSQLLTKAGNSEKEAERLRDQLKEITEREMREREQGRRMNSTVDQQTNEIQNLQFKLNEALETKRSLQAAADSAYKEMADLNKQMHELQSNQTEDLEKLKKDEEKRRDDIFKQAQTTFENEKSMLLAQISDAQALIERAENTASRKESTLKLQISDLQDRLQEAEQRHSELSTAMTASTRPLLRQIEQLQMSLTQQQCTSDEVEKSLTTRLKELQGDVSAQKERQRQAVEAAMEAHSKCTAIEAAQILVKEEKSRLEIELEDLKISYDQLTVKEQRQATQLEKYDSTAKKDKAEHENKMLILQQQLDQERAKLKTALETLKEKERQWALLGRAESSLSRGSPRSMMDNRYGGDDNSDLDTIGPAPGDSESISDQFSDLRAVGNRNDEMLLDSVISKTTTYEAVKLNSQRKIEQQNASMNNSNLNLLQPSNTQSSGISIHTSSDKTPTPSQANNSAKDTNSTISNNQNSTNNNSSSSQPQVLSTSVFESMQSQLKTREGELSQLLSQVEAFKRSRLHMSEEIVQLSNQCETLKNVEIENNSLKEKVDKMEKKQNMALQMLGEKQEIIDELKMDLADVKEMFKSQTEQMVSMLGSK